MIVNFEIPDYDGNAVDVIWEDGAKYIATSDEESVILKANSEGLLSLAKQMIYLALNSIPTGSHVHYDEFFVGKGVSDKHLIIEKI